MYYEWWKWLIFIVFILIISISSLFLYCAIKISSKCSEEERRDAYKNIRNDFKD